MKTLLAVLIWGVVNSTMVCKTSGNPFASAPRSPWSN